MSFDTCSIQVRPERRTNTLLWVFYHNVKENSRDNLLESFLIDSYISGTGKKYTYDWQGLKERTLQLSASFRRLGMYKQAVALQECGTFLEFIQPAGSDSRSLDDGRMKLRRANFCRNRLCSMCMKRRQMKIFGQASKVMNVACSMEEYDFLFLTLTVPNCTGEELPAVLDNMFSAFRLFNNQRSFKRAFVGWYRALEVNFNPVEKISNDMYWGNRERHLKSRKAYYDKLGLAVGSENPSFMTFHPHFHLILAVKKDYFTNPDCYLSQQEITEMWARCLGAPGEHRQVFIEKINLDAADQQGVSLKKSVSEVAKYPVKDFDILLPDRDDLTDYAVGNLYRALFGRKLIAYGGVLRKIYRQLGLTDPVDGDLVHVDDEKVREDVDYIVKRYSWRVGATTGYNYYLDESFLASAEELK